MCCLLQQKCNPIVYLYTWWVGIYTCRADNIYFIIKGISLLWWLKRLVGWLGSYITLLAREISTPICGPSRAMYFHRITFLRVLISKSVRRKPENTEIIYWVLAEIHRTATSTTDTYIRNHRNVIRDGSVVAPTFIGDYISRLFFGPFYFLEV